MRVHRCTWQESGRGQLWVAGECPSGATLHGLQGSRAEGRHPLHSPALAVATILHLISGSVTVLHVVSWWFRALVALVCGSRQEHPPGHTLGLSPGSDLWVTAQVCPSPEQGQAGSQPSRAIHQMKGP